MKYRILIFSLIAYFLLILVSCSTKKIKYNNSVLWEISKPEVQDVSYILGTIHVLDTTQINFPIDTFKNLIGNCKSLCLEIIQGKTDEMQETLKYMYLSDENTRISKQLEKEYYDQLLLIVDSSKYLLKYYKPNLDSIRPTILSFYIELEKQLMQTEYLDAMNYQPEIDFQYYAELNEYETIALETVSQQLNWLIRPETSFEESIEILKKSIDGFYNIDSKIDIYKRYSEQNLALLQPEDFSDSIMILRNIGMVEKIDSLLNIKSVFVAIGAAHLPTESGVLNLLEQRGYIIKPYKISLKYN